MSDHNWLDLDKVVIFKGNDENGNRYLNSFLRDYQEVFNVENLNASCSKCLEDYYTKFTKYLSTMKTKNTSGYVLKAKYNGIPASFGSQKVITNQNITAKSAKALIKSHPKGKELFEVIPEKGSGKEGSDAKPLTVASLKKNNTLAELQTKSGKLGINPEGKKTKDDFAVAIFEKVNAAPEGTESQEEE